MSKHLVINIMPPSGNWTLSISASNLTSNLTEINCPFHCPDQMWNDKLRLKTSTDTWRNTRKGHPEMTAHSTPEGKTKNYHNKTLDPPCMSNPRLLGFNCFFSVSWFLQIVGAWKEHSKKANKGNVSWNPRKKSGRKLTFWHLQSNGR